MGKFGQINSNTELSRKFNVMYIKDIFIDNHGIKQTLEIKCKTKLFYRWQ